jgi:3-hydroxy-9,10-secoandrosta-1,3,5(10)-triene-9,17-dione monooxygenase reductase component
MAESFTVRAPDLTVHSGEQALRYVMGHFCSGVVVVTSCRDGTAFGMSVQSFTSLSLDPPLVSISPARTSTSWPLIRDTGRFCVNILGGGQEELCRRFATSGGDKFAGVSWQPTRAGLPGLLGALAWIDCDIEAEHPVGDHTIVIGRVSNLHLGEGSEGPLLFFRGQYVGLSVSAFATAGVDDAQ